MTIMCRIPNSIELLPMTIVCRMYLQTLANSCADIDVSILAKTLADLCDSDNDINQLIVYHV